MAAGRTRGSNKRPAANPPAPAPPIPKRARKAPAPKQPQATAAPPAVTPATTGQLDLNQLVAAVSSLTSSMQAMREDIDLLHRTSQPTDHTHTSPSPSPSIIDTTPGKHLSPVVKQHFPHFEASVLLSVVSGTLEIKDLPKLSPLRERPKGRQNMVDPGASYHFDTGKVIHESPQSTFEKDVPSIFHLLNILHVYAGLRTLYDSNNDGFGFAINTYIRTLVVWHSVKHYAFPSIRDYVVQHFELHQSSPDPRVWSTTDQDLFTSCIRPYVQPPAVAPTSSHVSPTRSPSAPSAPGTRGLSQQLPVCRNFNDKAKGCPRRHVCILCQTEPVPIFQCKRHDTSKQ